jgi:hypothetical protein
MAALDIVTLDTATPQLEVPQAADTYNAPRAFAIAPVALTGSAATTSFDVTQTWNTTGTPTALKLNVTDTASNAASLLMDLQVGGASQFSVRKNGRVTFAGTLQVFNGLSGTTFSSGTLFAGTTYFGASVNGDQQVIHLSTTGIQLGPVSLSWGAASFDTQDLVLVRDAANTLAQRNGTNAQTFRIYNTFTDASNYERGKIEWASNVLRIGTEKAGTGTARALELQTDGTTRITLTANTDEIKLISGAFCTFTSKDVGFDAPSSGVFRFTNAAGNNFGRLQFGGTTSSFPALKRSSAALIVRLADDTANAALESASVKTDAPAGGTSGTWKLGVAATVSPTSPNRTIEVDIGGTIYYLAAKTTND